jgi:hypothetical protein
MSLSPQRHRSRGAYFEVKHRARALRQLSTRVIPSARQVLSQEFEHSM